MGSNTHVDRLTGKNQKASGSEDFSGLFSFWVLTQQTTGFQSGKLVGMLLG